MKAKKKKAEKEPFWKKISPEVKSFLGHVGKAVDNMKPNDWVNLAIYAGLAYQSFKLLGITEKTETKVVQVPYQETVGPGYYVDPTYPPGLEAWLKSGGSIEEYVRIYGLHPEYQAQPLVVTRYRQETQTIKTTEYEPMAALIGPIGLMLARTDNIISGAAGVAMLAALGLTAVTPDIAAAVGDLQKRMVEKKEAGRSLFGWNILGW